jgi:chorismate mutase
MKELRDQIDKIDAEIIKKISQRVFVAKKMGVLKAKLGKKVLDKKRELEIAKLHNQLSIKHKLSPEIIKKLFNVVVLYSRKVQK